jgi:GGDEF domain-containing protein
MTLLLWTLIIAQALIIAALAAWARHLAISPSFQIPVMAIGRLRLWTALGPKLWIYGDMDHLGLINDALTTPHRPGMARWNHLMTGVLRNIRARSKFLVYGGDEFGFELDPADRRGSRRRADARLFCERLQALLRTADYTDEERAALRTATGLTYASITLAYVYSPGWRTHRRAFLAAQLRVMQAKPKDEIGRRGEILEALAVTEAYHAY